MIRYRKMGYVALNVTDIERSATFYRDVVGLERVKMQHSHMAFLTCTEDYYNVVLYQSDQPGINRIGWELESNEQFDYAFGHLQQSGINPQKVSDEECEELKLRKAFRFKDPNGLVCEFYYGKMQDPFIYKSHALNIIRLGHVVMEVPNFASTLEFYENVLNFKASDYKGKSPRDVNFAFMRCFPNPYHHTFAIAASERLKLQHVAFMVKDIDDIGRGRHRLISRDIKVIAGPGRHEASGSIFLYFHDPDNLSVEYTLGMEEFPELNPRPARYLKDSPEMSDMWKSSIS